MITGIILDICNMSVTWMCMVQLWSVGSECIIYDCVCIKVADEKRNTANDTQYYYDVKNEKVLMIFDGMVDGEDNPELIEKILVMHGKQQQKQQEDLDNAAVYRICGDIRMRFQEEQWKVKRLGCRH